MDGLKLALLGKFQASFGEKALPPFRTTKVQALLIYLVVEAIAADAEPDHVRTSHRREALMELLWPNLELRAAQDNLRQTLYQLRKAIPDQQTAEGTPIRFLESSRLAVSINPDYQFTSDVAQFISDLQKGELGAAVALYRGDFLATFYLTDSNDFEEWAQVHRNRCRQQAINALDRLASQFLENGHYEKVLQVAGQQLVIDDLNEGAYRQAMEAQARLGRRQAALAQYEACRLKLDEELGVEPSLETERLLAQIQNDEIRATEQESARPAAPQMPQIEAEEAPLFVGRETELDQLAAAIEKASAGHGALQFIVGGAGRGKTALVTEFAGRALGEYDDLLVLSGQCRGLAGMGEPYLPFRHILAQLTGDVSSSAILGRRQARRFWEAMPDTIPLLVEQGAELIDTLLPGSELRHRAATIGAAQEEWFRQLNERLERSDGGAPQKERLFSQVTAVLKAIARKRPLLLIIEDLHWTDAASASLLFHLTFELAKSRILLLGTYRPEEVDKGDGHPLARIASELKRQFGDIWLDLGEKDMTEGRGFIDAYLDSEANALDERFRQEFFTHTGGHALFTVELLRALQERGDLYRDEEGVWRAQPSVDWESLPARVEGVIEQRFGRLDSDLQEALSVAAVQGERFTAGIVAEIARLDERQLVRRLSREVEKQHRLVEAEGLAWREGQRLARYRFRHQLFQQYLYGELPEGERIYLHQAVGLKLEALAGDTKALVAELAWHFDQAGDDEKALTYLLQAGDAARLLYATEEAVAHYERALAILKARGDNEEAARILMKLGLTFTNAFDFEAARQAYDESFTLREQFSPGSTSSEMPSAPLAYRLPGLEPVIQEDEQSFESGLLFAARTLRLVSFDHFDDFDPNNFRSIDVGFLPGLVKLSNNAGVLPDAAASWELLDEGRTYLFHLRQDAFWSDGRPLTSSDFICAWRRALDPKMGSPIAEYLFDIIGAAEYRQGLSKSEQDLGFEALDERTLCVRLRQPAPHFLEVLTHTFAKAVPGHIVDACGGAWAQPENIVSCGPFMLETWSKDSITLYRNRRFFGEFSGNVDQVEIRFGMEKDSLKRYREGNLDVVDLSYLPVDEFASATRRWADEYRNEPLIAFDALVFNVDDPPFDDLRLRRAFVLATDRQRLAQKVDAGRNNPVTGGFLPPSSPGHVADIALPYDPQEARRLLAEAGYASGKGLPPLTAFIAPFQSSWMNRYLLQPWREILGATISCVEFETAGFSMETFFERVQQERPDVAVFSAAAHYPDPHAFYSVGVAWLSAWQSEQFDGLVNQASVTMDQNQRLALFRKAEEILVEEAPIAPLLYRNDHYLVKPWIKNFQPSFIGPTWHEVIIEPHDEPGDQSLKPIAEPEPPPAQNVLRLPCIEGELGLGLDLVKREVVDEGLFPGLVQLTPDLDVVPDAARYWVLLDNGHTYRFHLRDDVRWSDGKRVTADDFVFAWRRMLDPEHGSYLARNLYDIAGAADYHQGRLVNAKEVGFRALNEQTLEIRLDQPVAYFLQILTQAVATAVPRHVVEQYGERWADADHIVTCGPFKVQSLDEELMVLRRDPNYHGRFQGNVQHVEYRSYSTKGDQLSGFDKDELDFFGLMPASLHAASDILTDHVEEFRTGPLLTVETVIFDVNQMPFDDARVRRAFVLATDRQRLAEEDVWSQNRAATGGFVPPGIPGHVPGNGLPFDPQGARRLLVEAGYPGGKGLPPITVTLNPYSISINPLHLLQPWQEILGVKFDLQKVAWDEYFDLVAQKRPHIECLGWTADYPDPDNFLRVAIRDLTPWRNEAYQALIEEARTSLDHGRRLDLFRQAEAILAQEAPCMPLLYLNYHIFVKPWITNYQFNTIFRPQWHKVIIEPH